MQIYVDADACPVVGIVERIAQEHVIPVMLLCGTNHMFQSVCYVGAGTDAVDFALVNLCIKGDIVVTQDYSGAAMAMGKGTCMQSTNQAYGIRTTTYARYSWSTI